MGEIVLLYPAGEKSPTKSTETKMQEKRRIKGKTIDMSQTLGSGAVSH